MQDDADQQEVCLPIRVSRETAIRLQALSDHCHADPLQVAASLLHDLLKEDEEAHYLVSAPVPSTTFN